MIEIRPMQGSDLEFVMADPFQDSAKAYPVLSPDSMVRDSITCVFEGEIVAVAGIIVYWPGVAEVWMMLTKKARKKGIFGLIAFNAIAKKINDWIVDHKLRRVQAQVRSDFPKALKMIKTLGFKYEGTKKQFSPDGADMQMFARII